MKNYFLAAVGIAISTPIAAQTVEPVKVSAQPVTVQAQPVSAARIMAAGTLLVVTPVEMITSKKAKEGTQYQFQVVNDIVENGFVIIPRASPVTGTMTWKTGRAVGGKSGKFEITFNSVNVGGKTIALRGTHRQEGRGNTVGALLGSMIISGRSAVLDPGQMINVFTAEPVQY